MTDFQVTGLNKVRRLADRAAYDRQSLYDIIDECQYCHVGFVQEEQPFVIPILHGRDGDQINLHGALASRLMKYIATGGAVCLTFTLLDGLVLARSLFEHSANYRSAVVFGRGRSIEAVEEKMRALKVISDHLYPGRWEDARPPNAKELDATLVVAIQIESASVKTRSGPPVDKPEDLGRPTWAGVLPLRTQVLAPQPDASSENGADFPGYLANYQDWLARK
jgi:nitroimidazol reductase NimA-like FMN-containing flavoprotein (pyridoxamine 5'-phosphate oxidase superfamily)